MQALLQVYEEMPPITRAYTTACVLTTVTVVSCQLIQIKFVTVCVTV